MLRCGLHQLEVDRLARAGEDTQVTPVQGYRPIAASVGFFHRKRRSWHWLSVDAPTLVAVRRLQKRRRAPDASTMRKYLTAACTQAGVERVLPADLRSSFVTLARESGRLHRPRGAGIDLAAVSAVVGHRSMATTSAYYDGSTLRPLVILRGLRLRRR
jgi:integrase